MRIPRRALEDRPGRARRRRQRGVDGLARDGLTLAMHICRGNSRSRWAYQGGYNPIAEALLSQVGVDTFLLGVRLGRARWHV
jgi:hypothetical protein